LPTKKAAFGPPFLCLSICVPAALDCRVGLNSRFAVDRRATTSLAMTFQAQNMSLRGFAEAAAIHRPKAGHSAPKLPQSLRGVKRRSNPRFFVIARR
jgi:hypothetical protein